jgi:O-antigen/teichoic acid export membrane protein
VQRRLKLLRGAIGTVAGRPMLREFVGFGGSTFLLQASRVGSGLIVAAMLGPVTWGTWYVLNLIIAYGSLTHLGALNGMNREVPAALGRGDGEGANALRHSALGVTLVGTGTASALLLFTFVATMPGFVAVTDITLMLILLWAHQAFDYVSVSLKSTTRFVALSKLQTVSSLIHPFLTIGGAAALGLHGFILGQVIAFGLVCLIAWRAVGVEFSARLDPRRARSLVRIGFPIMLVGLVYALFTTVDRWVVTAFLGTESLGHYSLAIMAFGAVGLLPQVVAQQYYPRVAHAWAARGDTGELRLLAARIRNMTLLTSVPVTAILILVLPPAVLAFLPAYSPGIPALLITVFVPIVGAFGQGYGGVLHMLDRQVWLLFAIIAAAAVNLGVSVALIGGFGLAGVAIGSLVAFLFYSLARVALGAFALRGAERP